VGDKLILTKPLGTGIISTAVKKKVASEAIAVEVAKTMASLNRKASELMQEVGAHACTDITGFGLIGHATQVAQNSEVAVVISSGSVPLLPGVEDFARQGLGPGGLQRNREFYSCSVVMEKEVPRHIQDILFDAQTSGGLLISVASSKADRLLEKLLRAGVKDATLIGEVVGEPKGMVTVR